MKSIHHILNRPLLSLGAVLIACFLAGTTQMRGQGATVYHLQDWDSFMLHVPVPTGEYLIFQETQTPGAFCRLEPDGTWWIHSFLTDANVTMWDASGNMYEGYGKVQMSATGEVLLGESGPEHFWSDYKQTTIHCQAWVTDESGAEFRVKGKGVFREGKVAKFDFEIIPL